MKFGEICFILVVQAYLVAMALKEEKINREMKTAFGFCCSCNGSKKIVEELKKRVGKESRSLMLSTWNLTEIFTLLVPVGACSFVED